MLFHGLHRCPPLVIEMRCARKAENQMKCDVSMIDMYAEKRVIAIFMTRIWRSVPTNVSALFEYNLMASSRPEKSF